jgi:hypothetical protein
MLLSQKFCLHMNESASSSKFPPQLKKISGCCVTLSFNKVPISAVWPDNATGLIHPSRCRSVHERLRHRPWPDRSPRFHIRVRQFLCAVTQRNCNSVLIEAARHSDILFDLLGSHVGEHRIHCTHGLTVRLLLRRVSSRSFLVVASSPRGYLWYRLQLTQGSNTISVLLRYRFQSSY